MDDHHHQLQLQIPHFVYSTAPTLVPGGGAEVIPVANASWFANNGFIRSFTDNPPTRIFTPAPEQQQESLSAPFEFGLPTSQPFSSAAPAPLPTPDLSVFLATPPSLTAPSPQGLAVYSASGFDLLSILARVATRPYPRIVLGPVDLTCSFVVVDVRRFDHPIVYCSPTFCALTGYSESEVIGRNCRFLQAPGGNVAKGEPRNFTSQGAVNHLRKSLIADKECQTSIVNYKKNGAAFINLVTVIPVPGGLTGDPDEHDIVYQVGFQVDLTEQPNAILDKLRDGSYLVNYAAQSDVAPFGLPALGGKRQLQQQIPQSGNARDRKANTIPPVVISKDLKRLLADPRFLRSIPITNSTTTSGAASTAAVDDAVTSGLNHPLHMLLLEASPDFIHVVSLKGSFLYVAPSVRRVLGYESDEMVGTCIADYAHPEDVIPLMRELKESSATGVTSSSAALSENQIAQVQLGVPRSVDLLFRAKTKMGRYVWVECRGRLHVEPGKGRKAIVLSGRAREMMNLKWDDVKRAGGLAKGLRPQCKVVEQEVWGMLGGSCKDTATFMSIGKGMEDVLGWTADDLLGRGVMELLCEESATKVLGGFILAMRQYQQQQRLAPHRRGLADSSRVKKVRCKLRKKDGGVADVWFIVYRADPDVEEEQAPVNEARGAGMSITPAALLQSTSSTSFDMFEELATSRGSSWQYELQQLRITNIRLQEELAALEA
ncbi:hypothetical protein BDZ97DRAFT_1671871, partial [Flammula alnicola]